MKRFLCFVCLFGLTTAFAQNIGYWKDHLPYNNAIAICGYKKDLFVATEQAVFIANKANNGLQKLSKVHGLSDVGVSSLNCNGEHVVIGYSNGNIDVLEEYSVYNVPHLKNKNMLGEKRINAISFNEDFAYLSCTFGVLELNLSNKEINNTFLLNAAGDLTVNEIIFYNDSLFAATDSGLYKASILDNLSDFHSWKAHNNISKIKDLAANQTKLFYTTNDSLFVYGKNNSISPVNNRSFLKETSDGIFLLTPNKGYIVNETGITEKHSNELIRWVNDIYTSGDTAWFADNTRGLIKKTGFYWQQFQPTGPATKDVYTIDVNENYLWVAPGGIDSWNNANVNEGVFWSDYYEWSKLSETVLETKDVVGIASNNNNKEVFVSTWNDGVIQLNWSDKNNLFEKSTQFNHLNTNGHLATLNTDTNTSTYGWIRVKSIKLDNLGNLWGANSQVNNPLFVRKNNGDWHSFSFTSLNTTNTHLGDMVIDNIGQKWVIVPGGVGLVVYNDNNTVENVQDDQDRVVNSSLGSGNLPSTSVYSLEIDRDGEIWVGTNKGIAVFYSPENVFSSYDFDAQQILVEVDGYVEYLLANETVTAIAVDGGNRKWLGTQSGGIFLVSPDGTEQIHHFTVENSPLFSNTITDIAINHTTGEVYIGTSKGLISYVSDATKGYDTHENVIVYPNPVRPEYNGIIAIKGVVEDAEVKITDLNGVLVYETTALGGQAVWDGKNGYGKRVQTGVYLVFSSNSFGTETNVAKILFIH